MDQTSVTSTGLSKSIRNIVVVGETGVGKSSLINLINGEDRAVTAIDVRGVTTTTEFYDWINDAGTFRLWDTAGFGQDQDGNVSPSQAQDALRSLLERLSKVDGVHLLVLCVRGLPRLTRDTKKTYGTIAEIRDKVAPNVPLAAVITDLEKRSTSPRVIPSMDEWWSDNAAVLVESMVFSLHACISTLPDDCYPKLPGRRKLCQALVRHLFVGGASPRLARNSVVAESRRSFSIFNIVVVGETGVGKSSSINLVTGNDLAVIANYAHGTTTTTEFYDWTNDAGTFRLWDTPGLGADSYGDVSSKQEQDALRSLLMKLTKGGGVHLLVLCMRGLTRVTKGMKWTYDTIVRIRDKVAPDVPVATVVTELEKRSATPDIISSMDEWWTVNAAALSDFEMAFSAHACITTLRDICDPKLPGRRQLCQGIARHLIIDGVSPKLARNIIVAGEIGVGKSSIINLVLGLDRAFVANDIDLPLLPQETMTGRSTTNHSVSDSTRAQDHGDHTVHLQAVL